MEGKKKINVVKCVPGPCYNQRLLCFLLKAFSFSHKKTGYNAGIYIRDSQVQNPRFLNIFTSPSGYSFSGTDMSGVEVEWDFEFSDKEAKKFLTIYGENPLQKQTPLILAQFMMVERNRDLVKRILGLTTNLDLATN